MLQEEGVADKRKRYLRLHIGRVASFIHTLLSYKFRFPIMTFGFSHLERVLRTVIEITTTKTPINDIKSEEENDFSDTFSNLNSKELPPQMSTNISPHQEQQYLNLIRYIIDHGQQRLDRTGTGTRSIFAPNQLRFDLSNDIFPLLTTKRVFFRAVAEELLWFVRGDTDARHLNEKGIKIWDGNASRAYLDKVGLCHRREGDLGPVYGFQWRHFGAEYIDCETNYNGKGVDQLKEVIEKIKTNPMDRRIIMSAWNPKDIPIMALPPCHMFCQFYVSTPTPLAPTPTLSCLLYQRSCDMGLGVPFNIASYALLTRMIAHVTGLTPGEFIHTMGDAHVYNDHVDALLVQLAREPRPFPTLKIAREVKDIDDFKFDDFVLEKYNPHGKIDMKMSV